MHRDAVVVRISPFALASRDGDMLWTTNLNPEHFVAIGVADIVTLARAMSRLTGETASAGDLRSPHLSPVATCCVVARKADGTRFLYSTHENPWDADLVAKDLSAPGGLATQWFAGSFPDIRVVIVRTPFFRRLRYEVSGEELDVAEAKFETAMENDMLSD
jgi:hypothetical protein